MTVFPALVLAGGIAAPLMLLTVPPPSPITSPTAPCLFWAVPADGNTAAPTEINAQVKHVAAYCHLPLPHVRRLVREHSTADGVDIAALNRALVTRR